MSRLSEAQKRAVPKSQRGIPSKSGTGSFPMPDKAHARAALALIRHAPASQRAHIRAMAQRMLGSKHGKVLHKLAGMKRG
jgi:hypothetical protein